MYITIACAGAVGAALGRRFQVFTLIPATATVIIVLTAIEVAAESHTWRNVLWDVIPVVALQAGYLAAAVFSQRTSRQRTFPFRPIASRFRCRRKDIGSNSLSGSGTVPEPLFCMLPGTVTPTLEHRFNGQRCQQPHWSRSWSVI
jgi:hypothetical protein